jgi:hypothetical protein
MRDMRQRGGGGEEEEEERKRVKVEWRQAGT